MVAVVHADPWDRDRRLSELGSTREQWVEVVKACVAGRGGCTDNDPQSSPGYEAWRTGVRRMREIFRPEGWEKEVINGIEAIVHRGRRVRITIANTDSGTSDRGRSPKNRTQKGPMAEGLIDLNNQTELFPNIPIGRPAETSDGYSIWYLRVFDDGDNIRAELSRPIDFRGGYFIKYSERVFILGYGEWDQIDWSGIEESDDDDITVDVFRRQ